MVQPISTSTNPSASHKQQKSNTLGQSIDNQYDINPTSTQKNKRLTDDELAKAFELLIQEHLGSEAQEPSIDLSEKDITPEPSLKIPSLPLPSKEPSLPPKEPSLPPVQFTNSPILDEVKVNSNWKPDTQMLDTQNQQRVISERIVAIKHSAANALTNLKFFLKDLSLAQIANKGMQSKLKQKVVWASKTKGANFELVQSYKQALNMVNKFINLSNDLATSAEALSKLLNQVEAGMDFIDIDISIGTENFEKSVSTCTIISNFSNVIDKVDELTKLLSNAGNPFKSSFGNTESLMKAHKTKIKAIRNYLKGPKSPELIKKPDADFESEMKLLRENFNLMNKYIPILKGCLKGKDFLESSLADVKLFVSELSELHRLFVISEYQALGKAIPGLSFNGEDILNFTS